ncbi:MAG: spore coat protein [Desulfobacterium sp.]|nr:spore coat protein [Desulfobacterium sp.]
MKGIILAGGSGSRLHPLTKVTNKHLLPVYDKPMIYYPLKTLIDAGIKDIIIVSGKGHAGHFLELLGSGEDMDMDITLSYTVQEKAGGIAQALGLTRRFVKDDTIAVILGDNIFSNVFKFDDFNTGAKIFLKEVEDAQRYGVANIKNGHLVSIEEKPEIPQSNLAVTGLYLYDNRVFGIIDKLKPSGRGELEITDVNNWYLRNQEMSYEIIDGFWTDAGTFESLYKATIFTVSSKAQGAADVPYFENGRLNNV